MAPPFGDMHDSIKKGVEAHHKRISEIDNQIAALTQEKAILKVSAMRELQSTLKLAPELVGHMVAACR